MSKLEATIAKGNRPSPYSFLEGRGEHINSHIKCRTGFGMSVIAGWGVYSHPREDMHTGEVPDGPFHAVEVGFPTMRPEPWGEWEQYCEDPESPTDTVYGYVPVDLVRALVEPHGGEVEEES